MSWSVPICKALRSLPFYVGIPFGLFAIYGIFIEWPSNTDWFALLKLCLMFWTLRQFVRFLLFGFLRSRKMIIYR
jgi:hypothetical protein